MKRNERNDPLIRTPCQVVLVNWRIEDPATGLHSLLMFMSSGLPHSGNDVTRLATPVMRCYDWHVKGSTSLKLETNKRENKSMVRIVG